MAMTKAIRQHIRSLKNRKERWAKNQIIVEGAKCIRELCNSNWKVERIYFTSPWDESEFWRSDPKIESVDRELIGNKDMEMISAMKTPPGMLAVAHVPESFDQDFPSVGLALCLDNVADPGNVGTLIRVADWFGLNGVILSPNSADPLGPKAIQSSMGSTFHVPIKIRPFQKLGNAERNHVVGLDAGGDNLFTAPMTSPPSLIVVGSESHGLSDEIRAECHAIASIPGNGRAESLNASIAGAVAVSSIIQKTVAKL